MISTPHAQPVTVLVGLTQWLIALGRALIGAPAASPASAGAVRPLPPGCTLTLTAPLGHRVDCVEGCVWITQDQDPRDVILSPGQSFTPDRDQRALIHALDPSRVRVTPPAR